MKIESGHVCFTPLSQQGRVMYEGRNDIACSRTTQDLLRQKNCDFIPAQCTRASSFKLLMSLCAPTIIRHSIRGLYETSKCTTRTLHSLCAAMTSHPRAAFFCTELTCAATGRLVHIARVKQ